MPLERKAPFSTTGGSKKMPPSKFKNKSGSVESLAKKNVTCSPPRQNKTPNKSGLTPIRPGKSPGTGMKLKSGLTPVRPGGPKLQSTSPFCFERKLKSGLLPIKPSKDALKLVLPASKTLSLNYRSASPTNDSRFQQLNDGKEKIRLTTFETMFVTLFFSLVMG